MSIWEHNVEDLLLNTNRMQIEFRFIPRIVTEKLYFISTTNTQCCATYYSGFSFYQHYISLIFRRSNHTDMKMKTNRTTKAAFVLKLVIPSRRQIFETSNWSSAQLDHPEAEHSLPAVCQKQIKDCTKFLNNAEDFTRKNVQQNYTFFTVRN